MLISVELKNMKQYLLNIILVAISMGICEIIAPNIKNIDKYIKMVGLLIVLCVIVSPITDLINWIDDDLLDNLKEQLIDSGDGSLGEYDEILNEYLYNFSMAEFKDKIKEIMNKEFGVPNEESEVNVFTDIESEEIRVLKIQILLSGKSIFKNPYDIENYFAELLGCECVVLISKN